MPPWVTASAPSSLPKFRIAGTAALACVDYVVIFQEPDPGSLIAALQPDILVKGGDWPVDRIVGRDTVEARGGRVQTIPLVPGVSTTTLVQRIRSTTA